MRFSIIAFLICIMTATGLADTLILNPTESTVTTPHAVDLEVELTNTQQVYGIEFTITDTPEKVYYDHIQTTGRTTGALTTTSTSGVSQVRYAAILSGTGNGIQVGSGAILTITYYAPSGSGDVDFNLQNVRLYGKNGNLLASPSTTGATVNLQASSGSSSAASGAGGAGGGGSGSSSSSSSGGSTSTSASTQAPFSSFPVVASNQEPAPQPQPEVIETEAQPIEPSEETQAPVAPQESNTFLWILAAVVVALTVAGVGAFKILNKKLDEDDDLPDPEPNPAPASVVPPQQGEKKATTSTAQQPSAAQQIIEQKLKK